MDWIVFVLLVQTIAVLGDEKTTFDIADSLSSPHQGGERSERFLNKPADIHIYVSPTGSDTNNTGLRTSTSVKTLTKALSMVPQYKDHDVYIELQKGYYDLDRTLYMENKDTTKLTVRAFRGQEVHVTGGKRLDNSMFKPVTDQRILSRLPAAARPHVRVAHLPDLNITNYGSIHRFGTYYPRTAPLEVFYNGEPLRLARWPNKGYINIVALLDGAKGKRFKYSSKRPTAWKDEHDIWAYGFWRYGWVDRALKVQSLDTRSQTVTLAEAMDLTLGHWNDTSIKQVGGNKYGGYFRFFNVLSELDEPGEYYMDNSTGNLYVWMPNANGQVHQGDVVYVSQINDCIILRGGSKNIVFQDFTLESCRGRGIAGSEVSNITVNYMEIRNTGGYSLSFDRDSRGVSITKSLIHDGNGGIILTGGNRTTLESSGNAVNTNEIYRFTREGTVGYRALSAEGVGTLVSHNHIHTANYGAIWFRGNNHIMEYNHIHHICEDASSCGAVMTSFDWTARGNTLRYNSIHHTLRYAPGYDNRGVILENQASGSIVKYNIFYDNEIHLTVNGGRDNIVENNIMYNATVNAMQVDARGIYHNADKTLIQQLQAVPYQSSLWTNMYPKLKDFDHQNKSLPEGNQIVKNLFYDGHFIETIHGLNSVTNNASMFNITQNGWSEGPSDFNDIRIGDFRTRCYASEWTKHFHFKQPPSPNQIGPRERYGPAYKRKGVVNVKSHVSACTTLAPATVPVGSYLPDGTGTSHLFNIPKQGCWLNVTKCAADPDFVGTYRDMYGENLEQAAENETMCFRRAIEHWRYCGSNHDESVMAIYGPTGASTVAGEGCYLAQYGCPKHGGPANGTRVSGKFVRDYYAEHHLNATTDEEACLKHSVDVWRYCGSHPNHPVTSIFRPTGATRTAGAGCWIKIEKCPKHRLRSLYFYDGWGESNVHSDEEKDICFSRALHYWDFCGSNSTYHVTAFYRPTASSYTVP